MSGAVSRLAGLHVIADDSPGWRLGPVDQARAACEGGAAVVQLRAKHASDGELLRWAHEIRKLTRDAGLLLLINDRFDLALASGADGVHLGQGDLPLGRLPAEVREGLLVGRSTHSASQLRAARHEAPDYLAFGPVFGTTSKQSESSPRGLPALREAAALARPHPLIAIGGIDLAKLVEVQHSGAAGIAVISAVAAAADAAAAVRALCAGWLEAEAAG